MTGAGLFGGGLALRTGATILAITLTGAGLIGSVFHLRRPMRAWRALSQWRSSWLSREGILAPAALALLASYSAVAWILGSPPPLIGFLAATASVLAVFATGMIYAQLRAIPAWCTVLTPLLFVALAAASGAMLAAFLLSLAGPGIERFVAVALLLNLAAWGTVICWWRRLDGVGHGDSTAESATGLSGRGPVRLLEPPHTGTNYLMTEMGFAVARRHARQLRGLALILGCILPSALVALALADAATSVTLGMAAILQLAGIAVSRWLFFAEAKHVVMLYYGASQN